MGEMITLTASDGHTFGAYKAEAEGTLRGGVVLIQEIFGVNAHIREVCDRFAEEGFAVIAPALFDRIEPGIELDYDEAGVARGRELKTQSGWDEALLDIKAAADALTGDVAVVGYCWGGTLAWLAATRLGGISCAACYYGGQIHEFREEHPRCPVMMHFGEKDDAIPLEHVEDIQEVQFEVPVFTYPAGHGFNCDQRASYHAESAATAHTRTVELFHSIVGR